MIVKTMISKRFFLFAVSFIIGTSAAVSQSITGISGGGVKNGSSAGTFTIDYVDNNSSTAANRVPKEFTLSFSGISGGTKLIFDAVTSSGWEFQQGSRNSNAWKSFCAVESLSSGQTSGTYCIRNTNTTSGTYTNTITIGFGSNCSSYTTSYTISVTAKVTSSGVYYWEGSSADSAYGTASNWYPQRSTKSTDDILVVDLGSGGTLKNSTINMDGIQDSVAQFIIKPLNIVTFRNSNSNGRLRLGKATSMDGDDFFVDTTSTIRKTGNYDLTIPVIADNLANIDGKIKVVAGNFKLPGAGTHQLAGSISTLGGSLDFSTASGTTRVLFLNGKNQTLDGTGGTLTFGDRTPVTFGSSKRTTITISRPLNFYNIVTLKDSCTITSTGGPGASPTASQWQSWTPFFCLKANLSTQGKLAAVPATATLTGDCLFEIYNNTTRSWRSYGIPLKNGVNLSQFADDIDLTGSKSGSNQDSFSTCSNCLPSTYKWVESTQTWSAYTSGNAANNIPVGKGTYVFYRGARSNGLGDSTVSANQQSLDFKGQLNTGSTTVNLDYNSSGSSTLRGYNLVGNPYPCPIDMKTVLQNGTNVKKRFVVYDALAKTYNVWDSSSSSLSRSGSNNFTTGGQNSSRVVAAGAAVFVVATGSGASVSFAESDKQTNANSATGHFKETPKNGPCDAIRMHMSYKSDSLPESDNALIEFNHTESEVLNGFDELDVPKLYGGTLGIGSVDAKGNWYSIDRKAPSALENGVFETPISIRVPAYGQYKFWLSGCETVNDEFAFTLFDKSNNKSIPVKALQTVEFDGTNNQLKDRFTLRILKKAPATVLNGEEAGLGEQTASTEFIKQNQAWLSPNPSSGKYLNLFNPNQLNIKQISVYQLDGRCVGFMNPVQDNQWEFNRVLNNGNYLLKIQTNTTTLTQIISITHP
jgi:hypothetical protein